MNTGSEKFTREIENGKQEVIVSNLQKVRSKLRQLVQDGAKNLVVITDFDGTLTKRFYVGEQCNGSFSVLQKSPLLSEEFKTKSAENSAKFSKSLQDPCLTYDRKVERVRMWWATNLKLVADLKLSKETIRNCILCSKVMFRDRSSDFFKTIIDANINCYIVSGGIKSVIIQCLELLASQKKIGSLWKNVRVCVTEEAYDKEGRLVDFLEPYVTSIDKSRVLTHEKYGEIKANSNAIVVGDYLLDLHAGDTLSLKTTLSIGYYNGCGDGTLLEYLLAYDIVVLGDGSFKHVTDIVDKVIHGDSRCNYRQVNVPSNCYQFFTKL